MIPKGAVRTESGKPVVWLVRDNKLERRALSLGAEHGSDVEVLAGVSAGDKLVVRGPESLREGQAVEIKQ
jgi:Fe2+ transport system protein FeoA